MKGKQASKAAKYLEDTEKDDINSMTPEQKTERSEKRKEAQITIDEQSQSVKNEAEDAIVGFQHGIVAMYANKLLRGAGDMMGFADGGIVPPGYQNDTFPAKLSSNEAVIPLDQLMVKFDAMTAAIASNRQSAPNIYLENTKLNSATAMGSYELNKGTTGSGR
jgi:hypothetical protein